MLKFGLSRNQDKNTKKIPNYIKNLFSFAINNFEKSHAEVYAHNFYKNMLIAIVYVREMFSDWLTMKVFVPETFFP